MGVNEIINLYKLSVCLLPNECQAKQKDGDTSVFYFHKGVDLNMVNTLHKSRIKILSRIALGCVTLLHIEA